LPKQTISDVPHLLTQFDLEKNSPFLPSAFTTGSAKKVWWRCRQGHSWQAQVHSRARRGHGCPYCSGSRILQGFNDLMTKYPAIAEFWDFERNPGLDPTTLAPMTHAKAWFKCSRNHSFEMAVSHFVSRRGCPICSGKVFGRAENDLATLRPDIAKEWSALNGDLLPDHVQRGAGKKVWWECSLGHTYQAQIANRTSAASTGCPYCSGQQVLAGFNDMATLRPDLADEFHLDLNVNLRPTQIVPGTSKILWWRCLVGHPPFKQRGYTRVSGSGCPVCAGKDVIAGLNDISTTHPELMAEWHFALNKRDPAQISYGSHSRAHWICPKGHQWQAPVKSRTAGNGCAQCAGQKAVPGSTDLASTHPELLKEWSFEKNLISPTEIIAGTNQKVWWTCSTCKWNWIASGNKRARFGQGCPMCQTGGFQIRQPSVLYFLYHSSYKARKIGITNQGAKPNRLEQFQALEWRVIRTWSEDNGVRIRRAEIELLRWIRKDFLLPPLLRKSHMGHAGGWSETFSLEGPSNAQIIKYANTLMNAKS